LAEAGEASNIVYDLRPRAHQDTFRLTDLGFIPRFTPEAALADYAAWLRSRAGR
jgi:nucleoside-diphosphate-sugar epimerase